MNAYPRANYSLTEDHLKEIYGPNYREMEEIFLKAQVVKKEPKQQQRIDLFGQVLSLMQWNLKKMELLPADYSSALTRSDEEIDQMLSNQEEDGRITRKSNIRPENFSTVEQMPQLADAKSQQSFIVPVYRNVRMLLHPSNKGDVTIHVETFNGRGEFIPYTVSTADGKQIGAGAMFEGRKISFNAEVGKSYLLDISSRGAVMKLEVSGAAIAYKSNLLSNTFQLAAGRAMEGAMPLYFYVPEDIRNFSLTLGTRGAMADIYTPAGRLAGKLNCSESTAARLDFKEDGSRAGFWKIILHKFEGSSISLAMDENLPQWLIPDPGRPLKIISGVE